LEAADGGYPPSGARGRRPDRARGPRATSRADQPDKPPAHGRPGSIPLFVTQSQSQPEETPSSTASTAETPGEAADGGQPAGFAELGVHPKIVAALDEAGIHAPFPIQELTIPIALGGTDLIGQARTGTGKTLAFGIPVLQRTDAAEPAGGKPRALVVVPTRELCVQVTGDLTRAGSGLGLTVTAVYGGRAYEPQLQALRAGVDVVVGTPGRLLDLARQGALDLSRVASLVLDEADEMLDLGFLPDVERILGLLPTGHQTLLFSATMPGAVIALARRFMTRPLHLRAEQPDEGQVVPTTQQFVFRAHALDKAEVLARVLQAEGRGLTIVFVRTRRTADKVAFELSTRGFAAAAVHGDLGQGQREQALRAFRSGKVDVLVATDVAARGIDVGGVTHVVNFQCPEDQNVYLHRIGRTGRAGESGVAVTFVDWDDLARWSLVNTALGLPFTEPLETYSTSPHLFEMLGIPAGTKGTLPRAQRQLPGLRAEEVEDLGEPGRGGRRRRGGADGPGSAAGGDVDRAPGKARARRRTRGGGAALAGLAGGDAAGGSAAGAGAKGADGAGADAVAAEPADLAVLPGSAAGGPDGTATASSSRRRRRRGGRGGRASASDGGGERAESA